MKRHRIFALFAAIIVSLGFIGCGITPEMITGAREKVDSARQVVIAAEEALEELKANPDADLEEIAKAEEVAEEAHEALDIADAELAKIETDESPEAGIVQSIGTFISSSTGQPWFYIAGVGIAEMIRQRRRAAKKAADANEKEAIGTNLVNSVTALASEGKIDLNDSAIKAVLNRAQTPETKRFVDTVTADKG